MSAKEKNHEKGKEYEHISINTKRILIKSTGHYMHRKNES
jgi:hypothetical protein